MRTEHSDQNVFHTIEPFLQSLIAEKTVSTFAGENHSNQSFIELIIERLSPLGFDCSILPIENNPGKYNLVAHLERDTAGIWLCGHSDTVHCHPEKWQSDPWTLHRSHDGWTGLGVADMKGFIAQMIVLMEQFHPKIWKKSISFIITADEESTMSGAKALQKYTFKKRPQTIFIGEPTTNVPVTGHKGFVALRIHFQGDGGHSSKAGQLPDALHAANTCLQALYKLRVQWQKIENRAFDIPWTTLNPARLTAGDSINRICSHATLDLEFRPIPECNIQTFTENIREIAVQCAQQHGVESHLESLFDPIPSYLNQGSVHAIEQTSGHSARTANFCTEAPFFNIFCPNTIVMGPGRIQEAHHTDETLYFQEVLDSWNVYKKILLSQCT